MKRSTRILLLAATLLIVLLSPASGIRPAHACSCAVTASDQAFQRSDVVFTGTVLSINAPIGSIFNSASPEQVQFQVSHVMKGQTGVTPVLTTAVSDASCGYPFQRGGQYLVYAYSSGNQLRTDLCSGTKLLAAAQGDLLVVGLLSSLNIIVAAAIVIAALALFWLHVRKKSSSPGLPKLISENQELRSLLGLM